MFLKFEMSTDVMFPTVLDALAYIQVKRREPSLDKEPVKDSSMVNGGFSDDTSSDSGHSEGRDNDDVD